MSSLAPDLFNGSFRILAQQETLEIVGPTLVREVMEVTASELPDEVVFIVRIPLPIWTLGPIDELVGIYAVEIQRIMAYPGVVDADFAEETTASGRILDFLDITVSPDGGVNSSVLHQPFGQLDEAISFPQIQWLLDVIAANLSGQTPPPKPPIVRPGGAPPGGF